MGMPAYQLVIKVNYIVDGTISFFRDNCMKDDLQGRSPNSPAASASKLHRWLNYL
jgi:hypothetical protein